MAEKPRNFFASKLNSLREILSILIPSQKSGKNLSAGATEGEVGETEEGEQTKPAGDYKNQRILIIFLIALLAFISILGGLYMGGIFGGSGTDTKEVSPALERKTSKKSLFETIFGSRNPLANTAEEKLAAMGIAYNPNNFVKFAGEGNMDVVKLFLEAGMSADIRRPIDGFTPLMAAATFNRTEIAEFLLDDNGANINIRDNDQQPALMKAIQNNRLEMIALLLERKADYNLTDKNNKTAIALAQEHPGYESFVPIFEKFGIDISVPKNDESGGEENQADGQNTDTNTNTVQETQPERQPENSANNLSSPTNSQNEATPEQIRRSRYPEISVEEFLRFMRQQSTPAAE